MISGSEIVYLQIAGIFGKHHHMSELFLRSSHIYFWPFLKQDPQLGRPLPWPSITAFKFPENRLRTRTLFLHYQDFCLLFSHSKTHFPLYFEHIKIKKGS